MILKIFITFSIIFIFLFAIRFLKKITSIKTVKNKKDETIVDLEKDPETDEYKPKE